MASFVCSLAIVGLGCQGNTSGPLSPSGPSGTLSGLASPNGSESISTLSSRGTNAVRLTEVAGSVPAGGAGIVNATQTAEPGTNDLEVTINVHGGPADTDLYFQALQDVRPATRGDGVCPGVFPAPPTHAGGDDGIIHTSPGGAGSTHVKFSFPEGAPFGGLEPGVLRDTKYRLVNLAQTFDLRSDCIVQTGK
jgi:hypothetical protein